MFVVFVFFPEALKRNHPGASGTQPGDKSHPRFLSDFCSDDYNDNY